MRSPESTALGFMVYGLGLGLVGSEQMYCGAPIHQVLYIHTHYASLFSCLCGWVGGWVVGFVGGWGWWWGWGWRCAIMFIVVHAMHTRARAHTHTHTNTHTQHTSC